MSRNMRNSYVMVEPDFPVSEEGGLISVAQDDAMYATGTISNVAPESLFSPGSRVVYCTGRSERDPLDASKIIIIEGDIVRLV